MIPNRNQIIDLTEKIIAVNEAIQSKTDSKEGILSRIEQCFQDVQPMIEASQNGKMNEYIFDRRELFKQLDELKKNCSILKLDKKSEKIASFFRNSLGGEENIRHDVWPFLSRDSLDKVTRADKNWKEEQVFHIQTWIEEKKLPLLEKRQIIGFAKKLLSEKTLMEGSSTLLSGHSTSEI